MLAEQLAEEEVLVQIPPDGIEQIASLVAPFLEDVIPYSGGKLEVSDMLERFKSGASQLWVIWETGEEAVLGVGATMLINYPRRKVCKAWLFASSDYRRCFPKLLELEAWARDEGCASMEITGRKGWSRVFTDYDNVGCILRKEL